MILVAAPARPGRRDHSGTGASARRCRAARLLGARIEEGATIEPERDPGVGGSGWRVSCTTLPMRDVRALECRSYLGAKRTSASRAREILKPFGWAQLAAAILPPLSYPRPPRWTPLCLCRFVSWLGSRGSSISLLATASACRRLRSRRWRTVLCFCRFVSWLGSRGFFDFAAGDGFCLPSTAISPLADCALPLPFCFLAWVTGIFDFAAGDGFCLPSTAISPLADCALPLPFCFLAWVTGIFDFAAGDGFCLPSTAISPLADCALPLRFAFWLRSRRSLI